MEKQNRQILLIECLLEVTSKIRHSTEAGNNTTVNAADLIALPGYPHLLVQLSTGDSVEIREEPGKGTS